MIERCGQCNNELKVEFRQTSVDIILMVTTCPNHGETTQYIGTAKPAPQNRIYGKCIQCKEKWFGENPVCLACRTMAKNDQIPKCVKCGDNWYGSEQPCTRCKIEADQKMKAVWKCQLCKEGTNGKLWSTNEGLVCEKCWNEMKGAGA